MGKAQQKRRKSSEKSGEGEDDSSFTCEICIEPISATKKFKNRKRCAHPFCSDCITKYIEVKIEENTAQVKCPGVDCKMLLDPLFCRPIVPVRAFEKWCDLLCESAVLQWERAYCPFPNCSALVLNECGGTVRRSQCPNCKNLFCFQCKLPWHAGYRCDETGEMRDMNDILFGQLVETKKWTRCPSCSHCVELRFGCSTVICRCGTRFCHACGGKLNSHWCWCRRNKRRYIFITCFLIAFCLFGFFVLIRSAKAHPYLP